MSTRILVSCSLLLLLTCPAPAQVPAPPRGGPPGWILLGDMYVPPAYFGDGAWVGTPWPNGVVPVAYDPGVNATQRVLFEEALNEIEVVCQVDFVPISGHADYLYVRQNTGYPMVASSSLGMVGGAQNLNVGSNLWTDRWVLVHELFHALGFVHEQSRPDRDTYVTINYANVHQSACNGSPCDPNFDVHSSAVTTGPYDFLSIMHYDDWQFSNGSGPTIEMKPAFSQFQSVIGHGAFMSPLDAQGLAARYGAPSPPTIASVWPSAVIIGGPQATITVTGTSFNEGAQDPRGVQGSRVTIDGTPYATTWLTPTKVRFSLDPASLSPGLHTLRVENDPNAGGASNAVDFTVQAPPCQSSNDRIGYAVATIEDVNGNGYDDYVIGGIGYNGTGQVWCRDGNSGQQLWFRPGFTNWRMGHSVAVVGDVTGDGIDDVAAGAPGYGSNRGRVQILDGSNGNLVRNLDGLFVGAGGELGYSVAGAGDIDFDGVPDVIMGAPSANGGTVEIASGATGTVIWSWTPGLGGRYGFSVGGGRDFTDDGQPDFVVGHPEYDGSNGTDCGRVWFYSGNGTQLQTRDGDGAYDYLGRSVAVVPHYLGGSRANVLAGAPDFGSLFGSNGGAGYVRLFRTNGFTTMGAAQTWYGNAPGDRFGQSVGYAGDLNSDGYPDWIMGANQDGLGASASTGPGYVVVRAGRTDELLLQRSGSSTGDHYGWSVAGNADFNDDAVDDLIVGSPFADYPCGNAGGYEAHEVRQPPERRKLMITEVSVGAPDGVELTNFGTVPVQLADWSLHWRDGTGVTRTTDLPVYSVQPGEIVVVAEAGQVIDELPAGTTVLPLTPVSTTSGHLVVSLVRASGLVADEVHVAGHDGTPPPSGLGGHFRGHAVNLTASDWHAERIWGLDSNGGSDWTTGAPRSFGLENRSSGVRGHDPLAVPNVVINETDDSPDYVELRNLGPTVDLEGWYLLCSAVQGAPHALIRPFPDSRTIAASAYLVIGDGATSPSELPGGVPYVSLAAVGGGGIPWTTNEYDCALYDRYGRLVDLLRTTGHDDNVLHNHPRAPAAWDAFTGYAVRAPAAGSGAIGRNASSVDTDTADDWRPQPARTMGSANVAVAFSPDPETGLDVRANATGIGGGMTVILNAGPEHAGERWSFAFSLGHAAGTGPVYGLGIDAIQNYILLSTTPPWFGFLDDRGAARLDFPSNSIPPGLDTDNIFVLQHPVSGLTTVVTNVLEFDT